MFRVLTTLAAVFHSDPAAAPGGGGGGPNGGDKSATEQASDRARQALGSGQTLEQVGDHHSARQPRDPNSGQFDGKGKAVPAAPVDGPAPAAAAVESEKPAEAAATAPPAEAAQEAAPAAEATEATPEGQQEEAAVAVIKLPVFNEGEEPFEIPVGDAETATRLQQVVEMAERGRIAVAQEQQLLQNIEALEEVRAQVEVDPAGYIMDMLPTAPAVVDHLVLFTLSQPEVWARLGKRILEWEDESTRRIESAEVREERFKVRDELQSDAAIRKEVNRNFVEVQNAVAKLIPATLGADAKRVFYNDALRDLQSYANRNNLRTLNVADIPTLLAARMRAAGIDPLAAAARAAGGNGAAAAQPNGKQRSGPEILAAQKKKEAAATIAPAGAGTPSNAGLKPPPGLGIKETTEWHRNQARQGQSVLAR
jgi:hypothetical protein